MSDNFPASISIGGELILESPKGILQKDWDEAIVELYECINNSYKNFEEETYNMSSIRDLEKNLEATKKLSWEQKIEKAKKMAMDSKTKIQNRLSNKTTKKATSKKAAKKTSKKVTAKKVTSKKASV